MTALRAADELGEKRTLLRGFASASVRDSSPALSGYFHDWAGQQETDIYARRYPFLPLCLYRKRGNALMQDLEDCIWSVLARSLSSGWRITTAE